MSIFLYNFTYIFYYLDGDPPIFEFYLSKKQLDHSITKNQKILWIRNWYFHQINASNNVFSFIVYINFAPKCHFPFNFQIKILSLECRWPSFFIFLFGRAYYKEAYFKKKNKKIYGWKIRHSIYLKVRDQNHFCTRLRRDVSQ